jgi:uncharacterized membrane protein
MFELLFKYPWTAFSKGHLVWLGFGPAWLLPFAIVLGGGALAFVLWRRRFQTGAVARTATIWGLQTAFLALLLAMLWQPALSVVTLKPQQNVVAVVVDDSRSMSVRDGNTVREDEAKRALERMLPGLSQRFQVRLYRLGKEVVRVQNPQALTASDPATHLGAGLRQLVTENSTVPVGAVVLLSDGADNSGGIDAETVSEFTARQIPIHTVGFGRERLDHDIEILSVDTPTASLAGSRAAAQVSLRQRGFAGGKAKLAIRDGTKVLAMREITLSPDGAQQSEPLTFQSGNPGVRNLTVSIDPLPGEENVANNRITRVIEVRGDKPRLLYVEGEPRWEFKFIRRAMDEDQNVQLVTLLRATQNKNYRQGLSDPKELEEGFPTKREELFGYSGLVLGSLEANWLTTSQHELIREFVDKRGGGLLFLAGRFGLAEGGYTKEPFTDLLPVTLPNHKNTYHIAPAYVDLTMAGRESMLCRLVEDPDANAERWKKLPYIMNWQEAGTPKAGALVLAESIPGNGRNRYPLLVTENFGRGRTAVFASSGSWRWQMLQPVEDKTHETFWQQMMRWLVTGTPGPVVLTTSAETISDDSHAKLRAEVRDKTYTPAPDAQVEARVIGPDGSSSTVPMRPDPSETGVYMADVSAPATGSYVAEAVARRGNEELGRGVAAFRREDGVAEDFHIEQNRELLERLASQTGGHYYRPADAARIGDEITYSQAGLSVRQTLELWNMPFLFLLALVLRSSEWLLRRRWGLI